MKTKDLKKRLETKLVRRITFAADDAIKEKVLFEKPETYAIIRGSVSELSKEEIDSAIKVVLRWFRLYSIQPKESNYVIETVKEKMFYTIRLKY